MPGKNALCPCGSGKRYATCCFPKIGGTRISRTSPQAAPRKIDFGACAAVFSIALLLRLGLWTEIKDSVLTRTPILDGAFYLRWAAKIAAGNWAGGPGVFELSPGYSYLLALFNKFVSTNTADFLLFQCLIGASSCVIVCRIARKYFGTVPSLIAGLLLSAYGTSVFYANVLNKACWIEFLDLVCLIFFLDGLELHSWGRYAFSGIALGLSAQFRPNILLLAPLLLFLISHRHLTAPKLRSLYAATAFTLGLMIVLGPVALRNKISGGEWVVTTAHGGMNFYTGNTPQSAAPYRPLPFARSDPQYEQDDFFVEAQRRAGKPLTRGETSRLWYFEAFKLIKTDYFSWAELLAKKFFMIWCDYEQPINQNFYFYREVFRILIPLSFIGFGLLSIMGLCGALTNYSNAGLEPLHLFVLSQALGLTIFFPVSEYRYPLASILAIYAAGFMRWLWDSISLKRLTPFKAAAIACALFITFLNIRGAGASPLDRRQDMAVAYNNFGGIYMAGQQWQEAIAALNKSVAEFSDYADAHYNLGGCYLRLNRPKDAEIQLLEGLRLNSKHAPPNFASNLALSYAAQGDVAKATKALESSLLMDPHNPESLYSLALLYRRANKHWLAVETVDKLLAIQPDEPRTLVTAIELAIDERNQVRIFELLPRLASVAPENAGKHELIGRSLASMGHLLEAKSEFEKAIAIDPNFSQANGDLMQIETLMRNAQKRH